MRRFPVVVALLALIVSCLVVLAVPLWGDEVAGGTQSEVAPSVPTAPAPTQDQTAQPVPAPSEQPAATGVQAAPAAGERPAAEGQSAPSLPPAIAGEQPAPVLPIPQPVVAPPIVGVEVVGNEQRPRPTSLRRSPARSGASTRRLRGGATSTRYGPSVHSNGSGSNRRPLRTAFGSSSTSSKTRSSRGFSSRASAR